MTDRIETPTLRVDPARPLTFQYLERELTGLAGDTVASAMYAAGVRVFSRSFKYHRPRGLYGLDGECGNTLMRIDDLPNELAETTLLAEGMAVRPQNVSGDPTSDPYGFMDKLDRWMPAGFYYHRFHKPARLWPFFQNRIRGMAGLGELDPEADFDASGRYEVFLNAEVAVIGGGPAGLSAALAAAEAGGRVVLLEARPRLGGHLDWRVREHEGRPLHERVAELERRVRDRENIRVFTRAPVSGLWGDNLITGFQAGGEGDPFVERYYECRAKAVVVATGCRERPLVFEHNDRPGVMGAGCAWRLARTYGVLPGERAVFSVGDDLGLEAAADLASPGLGLKVLAVADARSEGHDPELVRALDEAGVELLTGWAAGQSAGTKGVRGVTLGSLTSDEARTYDCDLVVANAGRSAVIGPLATGKARLRFDRATGLFLPEELPRGVFAAGGVLGFTDVESIEASGRLRGLEAAGGSGAAVSEAAARLDELPGPAPGCLVAHGPGIGEGRKAFICLDEDGTYKVAKQCVAQGFDVPELAKRFGGFGLGPGQHKVPGQNLAMVLAELAETPLEEIMATTVRPPLVPSLMATYAGPNREIFKRTPLHDDQAARGGIFRQAGVWKRARYFSEDLNPKREILNVRENVGMIDVSTLGKFRLFGPDALAALQRVYIGDMSRTRPGRCKYAAMCNDTGNLVDDGVVVRVGENDYYLTTSSNRAGITVEWFRYHTRYEGWDFNLVNLTDALGAINLAGPKAREVLEKVTGDDVSPKGFPYMGYRELELAGGVRARCVRLGFVGELSFELHVPASLTQYVWDLLWEAGEPFGIQPFGLEAQYCLRAEKGHVIIGAETEQRVTLLDLGLGFLWDREDVAHKKVGAPALRACAEQEGRLKLVGFRVDDAVAHPQDGDIVYLGHEIVGYVCTTRISPSLGWQYGMALVREDQAEEGGTINIYEGLGRGETRCTATVVAPPFYDPAGERLRT